ncbi:hypothetical protein RhiirA4_430292 [Rhizophagus irregularis]|uniref:Uncharacterized protein n=1 Tax=Rhizophagus irregularis TaxID=588596 RepID=A0A2I1HK65_9GLOM|nr:hypothetical protein RhiirA4_430292 [Rhizophagus irregularis]
MGDEDEDNMFDESSEDDEFSKGKRKLVAYFANWETTLMTLEAPPVTWPSGKELKWCRHSIPNLKKAQPKPKTKKTPNKKKSGNTDGNNSVSNQSKKKDKQQSSTKAKKNNNELKNPTIQKKAKKSSKNGVGGNKANIECVWANLYGEVSSRGAPLFNGGRGFVHNCVRNV